jgi:unspecific monooxygenase
VIHNDWSGQPFPRPPGRRRLVGDVVPGLRETPLQSIMARGAGLGPIFGIRAFRQQFVIVAGAALAAELCDEQRFAKALSPALEQLRELGGAGLFTAHNDEPEWRLAHDLLRPAFSKQAMERYHPVMVQTSDELFARWDAAERPVDVSRDMTKLTLETLSRTAFSQDFGSFASDEPHPFIPAMVAALKAAQRKSGLDGVPGASVVRRRIDRHNAPHLAYLDGMLDDVVRTRRTSGHDGADDLLGLMLDTAHPQTGERLPDENIRHQILTFLIAGHETTSGALSFALYYLSRHPEVVTRAQAEVDAVLGADPDAAPTFAQVPKLRYVRRVLDEALRLWPTAPAFARSPHETTTLGGRWRMRPQDWALVLLPMVHRDPQVWGEDAEEFDPDRFLPARSKGRPPHVYKPFGTGERACIGRQFALHEAVLVLARLLHRYDVAGDPGYELRIAERLTMMPVGFELSLQRRTPAAAAVPAPVPAADAEEPEAPAGCPVHHVP